MSCSRVNLFCLNFMVTREKHLSWFINSSNNPQNIVTKPYLSLICSNKYLLVIHTWQLTLKNSQSHPACIPAQNKTHSTCCDQLVWKNHLPIYVTCITFLDLTPISSFDTNSLTSFQAVFLTHRYKSFFIPFSQPFSS